MSGGWFDADLSRNRYGLHIYHNILDRKGESLQGRFVFAFGSKGQVIYMMPDKDLDIVRLGEQVAPQRFRLYSAWRSMMSSVPHS